MKIWKKLWVKIVTLIAGVLLILASMFFIYTGIYYKGDDTAWKALEGSDQVKVTETSDYYQFTPQENDTETGLIFYPGGKVQSTAYAPLAEALAEEGITTYIVKMPFRLAVLNQNGADKVIASNQEIENWYIGGHSLGGAMAAQYAASHYDQLKGLVLMGAYPIKDLKSAGLKFLSIYGSEDQVMNQDNFEKYKTNAPENAVYYEIEGGNHAYYGNYGEQKGDGEATITPSQQQETVVKEILSWITAD